MIPATMPCYQHIRIENTIRHTLERSEDSASDETSEVLDALNLIPVVSSSLGAEWKGMFRALPEILDVEISLISVS